MKSLKLFLCLLCIGYFSHSQTIEDAVCRDWFHMQECFKRSKDECLTESRALVPSCFAIARGLPPGEAAKELSNIKGLELNSPDLNTKLGTCIEITAFKNYKNKMEDICKAHFEDRIKDFEKLVGSEVSLSAGFSNGRDASAYVIIVLLFVVSLIGGVLTPMIIAFYWWRNKDLTKFPIGNFLVLILISCILLFFLPLATIAASNAEDNPLATVGITLGWVVTVLLFWPSLWFLHHRLKKRKKNHLIS